VVAGVGSRRYAKLTVETRSIFVPTLASSGVIDPKAEQSRWLKVAF